MELFLAGIDQSVAPLEVREPLAVARADVPDVLRRLMAEGWAQEALLVATCNRTELYVVSPEPDAGERTLSFFRGFAKEAPTPESGVYRELSGPSAAQHLFRVAAGLESAILGETEIQGQVRDAHEAAVAAGTARRFLDRLARGAIRTGKRVRAETEIAAGGISHGSATVQVVRRIFGQAGDRNILVVGAGVIARQTARTLANLDSATFVVANRTATHAEELAAELPNARVVALEAVEAEMARAHVTVLAGGAGPMDRNAIKASLGKRRDPLLLVDLGVPRLAAPDAARLPGVFLYDLEALEQLVESSLAQRRAALPAAEAVIAEEFATFRAWRRTLDALPAIHSLNAWAEDIRQKELSYLPEDAGEDVKRAVDGLTKRLVKKLLARPASRVVEGMEKKDPSMPTPEHLRSVFGLGEEEKK